MKTELLVQMDGLAKSDDLVFLLAASNIPWYLILRKLFHQFKKFNYTVRLKLKGTRPCHAS
jgi:SpoVK/Ycf46/Vps4 family AAA+-type ATPase